MGKIVHFGSHRRRRPRRRLPRRFGRAAVWLGIFAVLYAVSYVRAYGPPAVALPDVDLPVIDLPHVITAGNPSTLTGRAAVVDGDTIEIAGKRVRLNGIDAPESSQECEDARHFRYSCGAEAAEALDKYLAKSRPVRCEFVEWDRYSRFVGNCFRANGDNVAAWLVENGHALDWPRHSNGAYASQQAKAKAAKRGLWAGAFQEPWEWRSAHSRDEQSVGAPLFGSFETGDGGSGKAAAEPRKSTGAATCNIKGNISESGERIYHLPGQEFYSRTRISLSRGERWFCSESEARSAGWRRAQH